MESDFLGWLSGDLGVSQNTLIAYRGDLRVFARFLDGCTIQDATAEHVAEFMAAEQEQGRAYSTRVRRMSSLRKYYAWLRMCGMRADDPTGGVSSPRPT